MKKFIARYWRVIFFTFIYLTFISDKEIPYKYIYIFILSVFILLIDIVWDRFKKKKDERTKPIVIFNIYLINLTVTLLFFCLPSDVSLLSTGSVSPLPDVKISSGLQPSSIKKSFTLVALLRDNS